jgi:type IV secretory pathway VirJ component
MSRCWRSRFRSSGAWRDVDKTSRTRCATRTFPLSAWITLRYFWSARSPEQTASDLDHPVLFSAIAYQSIALIGNSIGADVLPLAYNRLSKGIRDKISVMSLSGDEWRWDEALFSSLSA